uniref:Amine oxidase domain-containing protein n=1 Tax=Denticeps clupeoides TaxID=299321 RepID=A0AAY4DB29_9TELE
MSRVLIVGAGLTGGVCACLLRRDLADKVQIVVWDKSRGTGGRMSTSRSPADPSCIADLGAQYITATPHYAKQHKSFYEELLKRGLLKPLAAPVEGMLLREEGLKNYVTPLGVSSIVKHYLRESAGAEVVFQRHVTHLYHRGPGWEVHGKGGVQEQFDVVVLTMPVPQILQLQGDVAQCLGRCTPTPPVEGCCSGPWGPLQRPELSGNNKEYMGVGDLLQLCDLGSQRSFQNKTAPTSHDKDTTTTRLINMCVGAEIMSLCIFCYRWCCINACLNIVHYLKKKKKQRMVWHTHMAHILPISFLFLLFLFLLFFKPLVRLRHLFIFE